MTTVAAPNYTHGIQNPSKFLQQPLQELSVSAVENEIRKGIIARHARTNEFFKDFDRLRTGFISKAQFDRCLDQHYGIVLSPEQDIKLMTKYGNDPKQPGMVNYRQFCKTIDAAFDPTQAAYVENIKANCPDQSLSARRPLSPSSLKDCDELLARIAPYYKYHGISIKSSYEDFDLHNIGLITESQFYRRFPGPPDVKSEEQALLAKKYFHPTKPGLCNYLALHHDLEKMISLQDATKHPPNKVLDVTTPITEFKNGPCTTIQEVFNKIRVAVHKNGIRTTEFFKDHDKLRSGVITRNQFVCGLSLCCGTQANLSRDEIDMVVEYYKTKDGRVHYKEFCHVMENAFNVPDLEKRPTADVFRPPVGALAKMPNNLSDEDEKKVDEILARLRETVMKKRLMLYPYFKDFDRGFGYTRGTTKTQFSRMLHMVGLDVSQCELELILRKFEYPCSGDINYPAFIQTIDSEYCGRAPVIGDWNTTKLPGLKEEKSDVPDISSVNVDELMKYIQHDVLVNRIRVQEFFQDFDPLRHGSISISRFRMGLSSMGQSHLSEAQIMAIIDRYADPERQWCVLWTQFLKDVEKVFTKRGLEKTPKAVLQPPEDFIMPKPGTSDWERQETEKKESFNKVMHKMRQKTNQRRILTKPCFQDFDRHHIGYVTKSQLRQCIAYLCLDCEPDEIDLLYEKFSDNTGFNYLKFLEELQPSEKQEQKYLNRLQQLKLNAQKKEVINNTVEISVVMYKIKTIVVKKSIRVYEFMKDYDKLKTGRMLKTCFRRALDLSCIRLTEAEFLSLTQHYTSPGNADYVDYYAFCDDVESAFTQKGLEKNPTAVPVQFKPDLNQFSYNKLSKEAEDLVENVMQRLAGRVRIRRIQVFPFFEDYDRVHNGSVSRSQLHRVLSELELGSLVSAREFHVLYEKFDLVIGGKHDFNYVQFCDRLNEYAKFDPHVP